MISDSIAVCHQYDHDLLCRLFAIIRLTSRSEKDHNVCSIALQEVVFVEVTVGSLWHSSLAKATILFGQAMQYGSHCHFPFYLTY